MKPVEVGFDTIGNATIICYDKAPVLVTDPWIKGSAYFGSWGLSHTIPEEQLLAIGKCKYVWYSHGHPDHLNWDSINDFREQTILLPNHYGKRIYNGLQQEGFKAEILQDKKWYRLSDKVRVMCFADMFQDAVLLIDINGRLIVNTNDASRALIWNHEVRRIIKKFDKTFLLSLTGHGDAEMINFRDESGNLVEPPELMKKNPLGAMIKENLEFYGIKTFVPFSSLHRYQRSDSIWAEAVSVKMEEYQEAHLQEAKRNFPPFIRYDCALDTFEEINPEKNPAVIYEPAHFGDDWSERLENADIETVRKYFTAVEGLRDYWDFVNVKIGGEEHLIELKKTGFKVGITFEAPKNSFMFSVNNNIFEDMLIGNYMRTTWHGKLPSSRLYPDTLPLVKYADNGLCYTKAEVEQYVEEYRKRYPFDSMMESFQKKCAGVMRKVVNEDSGIYNFARKINTKLRN
jgi:hypothetical protein